MTNAAEEAAIARIVADVKALEMAVDRVGVASATKTLPSTDYKSTGRPEIVVEIRGPTTSRLLQPGGRGSPGATIRGFGAFPRYPVHPGAVPRP